MAVLCVCCSCCTCTRRTQRAESGRNKNSDTIAAGKRFTAENKLVTIINASLVRKPDPFGGYKAIFYIDAQEID